MENLDILVACDVDNPLCGPKGASFVFGPQKGAREEDLPILDKALAHYSKIAEKTCGKKVAEVPGAGAAGGLGAGLLLFTKAKLKPGIEIVLEALGMEGLVKSADLVVTGEGCTEYQTLYGKAPIGIAMLAAKYNVPVLCLSGALGKEYELIYEKGISVALSCATGPMSLEESMEKVLSLVESGSERAFRLIKLGQALQFKK